MHKNNISTQKTIFNAMNTPTEFARIIYGIVAQLGGDEFTGLARVTPYRFVPEVHSFLKYACCGIKANFDGKIVLIMYDRGKDLYIVVCANGCKNPTKVYQDLYLDKVKDIIEAETGITMPEVEYYEDCIVTDF